MEEIHFCDECEQRIARDDARDGQFSRDGQLKFCRTCRKPGRRASARTASTTSTRTHASVSGRQIVLDPSASGRRDVASSGSPMTRLAGGFAAAIVVAGGAYLSLRGGRPSSGSGKTRAAYGHRKTPVPTKTSAAGKTPRGQAVAGVPPDKIPPPPVAIKKTGKPPNITFFLKQRSRRFREKAAVELRALVTDPDDDLVRVEFFVGDEKIGEDATLPYHFVWSSLPAGTHTLRALARDRGGNETLSTEITIDVASEAALAKQREQARERWGEGLVAYWSFDEADGKSVEDLSGNLIAGELVGDARIVPSGKMGKALALDRGGHMRVRDTDALTPPKITIAFWLRYEAGSYPFSKRTADNVGGFVWEGNNFWLHVGRWYNLVVAPQRGPWEHFALTYDGAKYVVYRNGRHAAERELSGPITNNTADFTLGRDSDRSEGYFKGAIDDVRIYNRALSETEIFKLARPDAVVSVATNAPDKSAAAQQARGPVIHWAFNDKEGHRAEDASGNGHHGQVLGNPSWWKGGGHPGGALSFDGKDDGVWASMPPGLTLAEVTVSFWVNVPAKGWRGWTDWWELDTSKGVIVGEVSGNSKTAGNGAIALYPIGVRFGGAGQLEQKGPIIANTGWRHVVYTLSRADNQCRAYLDAKLINKGPWGAKERITAVSVGYARRRGKQHVRSVMDEFRLYDRVLSGREIGALFKHGGGVLVSATPQAQGYLLDGKIVANLRKARRGKTVRQKSIAAVGSPVILGADADAALRGKLLPARQGYEYKTKWRASRYADVSAVAKRYLSQGAPELIRVCLLPATASSALDEKRLNADLDALVKTFLDAGTVPVLYTVPVRAGNPRNLVERRRRERYAKTNALLIGAARRNGVPCLHAAKVLGAGSASKVVRANGLPTRAGHDAINAKFAQLYAHLEEYVFHRRQPADPLEEDDEPEIDEELNAKK